ncbi:MAG: hypothetical protein OEM15_12250 [Myxococcales bacterium]|nr:hypothetical protein [Myxococcales bacterium]MDH3484744.1 hypothetical protein [Myxococcales bacterium]
MKWCTGVGLGLVALLGLRPIGALAQEEPEPEQPAQQGITEEQLVVAVPGLRALDGDDDIANELSGWLRAGSAAVEGWRLHTAVTSLEQFMLVHGCASSNEDCLSRIASTLEADRLIVGSLRRAEAEGPESQDDFEATLLLFDARTGRIKKTSRVQIKRENTTPEELAVFAQQEVERFAVPPFDELGQAQAIELQLSRDAVPQAQSTSSETGPTDIFPIWPAATSYAGAIVFVGLTAWSQRTIESVEQDSSFVRARALAGPEVNDICGTDTRFGVQDLDDLCSKANTHEALRWVFLGMGVASLSVGTWLLVKSIKSRKSAERPRVELTPVAGKKLGGVSARLEF